MATQHRKIIYDPDKLLSRDQKEIVVKKRLIEAIPNVDGEFVLTYDARFGWDFEVTRGQAGKAKVTFSAKLSSPRFAGIVKRCAQAIIEIRFHGATAKAIRGVRNEECLQ